MKTSEQINEIAGALAAAQGALKPAVKDAVNPAYRSKYADLASVWEACREALPKHGLAAVQDVTNVDGGVAVTTRIVHKSGQWIECGPLEVPMAKPDAHGLGSAVSYGKRYALSAVLGVVSEEDDDGNGAVSGAPGKIAGYYNRPAPKAGIPAEQVGLPRVTPPTTPEEVEAAFGRAGEPLPAKKAAIQAGPITKENIELRVRLVAEADAIADELGVSDEQAKEWWLTYCGGATRKNVDVDALRDFVKFLSLRLDQKKSA